MEDLQPSDILIHIINILVLFVLLRAILFKPVSRFLLARSERIAEQLADAEAKQAESAAMKAEYEKYIASSEAEGRGIIRESQVKASQEATVIIKEARGEAEKIIADAHEKIVNEKALAVAAARTEITFMATEIAARILKREVSAADNQVVADDFFHQNESR